MLGCLENIKLRSFYIYVMFKLSTILEKCLSHLSKFISILVTLCS